MRAQGVTQDDIQAQWPQLAAGDALAGAINALLQGHRLELFHNEGGDLVYRATSAANAQKCSSALPICCPRTSPVSPWRIFFSSPLPQGGQMGIKGDTVSTKLPTCRPLLTRERQQDLCAAAAPLVEVLLQYTSPAVYRVKRMLQRYDGKESAFAGPRQRDGGFEDFHSG